MKYIEEITIENKNVILRLDLNVTLKDGVIIDDTKIKKSIPTIKYLLNKNNHLLIMSHLGKVKTNEDKEKNDLSIVAKRLEELLGERISFINATRGYDLENSVKNNRITLMQNTRYEDLDGKKESGCDEELSRYWSTLGEIFVNDAFGTTHRKHASNYGISKYLPSAYGFLIHEEIIGLEPIITDIKRPFTVIMGGAKVDDKVKLIESLLETCDYLLVGGGIANTFLKAIGYNIGMSLYSSEYVDNIKELIAKYQNKIILPRDVVIDLEGEVKTVSVNAVPTDGKIYDIGNDTVNVYAKYIQNSKTVFVNGTMGMYEEKEYRQGTENLYKSFESSPAIKIAGGGDAVASVKKLNYENSFDFMSTGGGASLEYIADKKIKCFEE